MLVTIVAVPNADNTGLDKDRLEKVEDLPTEVARKMLDIGTAREPSGDELEIYRKLQVKAGDALDDGDTLPSGKTEVHNNTGRGEIIQTPERPSRPARKATGTAPDEQPTGDTAPSEPDPDAPEAA